MNLDGSLADRCSVYVDNKTVFLIVGSEMDYIENQVTSEFVFSNPNAKGICGCGESFNT